MTNRITEDEKVVFFELPKGTRRKRRKSTVPPAVIEIRIDVNRNDTEPQETPETAPAVHPVAQAIEQAAVSTADPNAGGLEGLMGQLGGAVRDRIDGIVGVTGDLVENRVKELIDTANSKIDRLVEETVNEAMDAAIRKVVGQRISNELGVTIDLTQLEDQPAAVSAETDGAAGDQTTPSQ